MAIDSSLVSEIVSRVMAEVGTAPAADNTAPVGVSNRHIHMSEEDGAAFGLRDGDYVTVEVNGERRTTFYDVQVRVHKDFRLEMHIDTDDANAAGVSGKNRATVRK